MRKYLIFFLFTLFLYHCADGTNIKSDIEIPHTICLDANTIINTKDRLSDNDPLLRSAYLQLISDADLALQLGPFTVIHKSIVPPGGTKHDFMSFGPYWWPNPDTPDGLPYIRRDGEVNPESVNSRSNAPTLGNMVRTVETLALAWYFSGDTRYAEHASYLLRVFFLDDSTRMNPHLEYGQAIPGRVTGRGIGIIGTRIFMNCVDAICLLKSSPAWTEQDEQGMQQWMNKYLDWLLNSEKGQKERSEFNNHGTWWDVQAAAIAIYAERDSLAKAIIEQCKILRIANHIKSDGSQPHELARTKSYSYSLMNLRGFFELAAMAEKLGIDLWNYQTPEGGSLRKAMDFLTIPLTGKAWQYELLGGVEQYQKSSAVYEMLIRSAKVWNDSTYKHLAKIMNFDKSMIRTHLLYHDDIVL